MKYFQNRARAKNANYVSVYLNAEISEHYMLKLPRAITIRHLDVPTVISELRLELADINHAIRFLEPPRAFRRLAWYPR